MKKVELYTDGACSGNPGKGGYGGILIYQGHEKEYSGYSPETTNNRMEITAVIEGLKLLKEDVELDIYSDSAYVVNAFEQGWIESWQNNGWRTAGKKPVQNIELWQELLTLLSSHKVTWNKVKGHADNVYNNRCDKLATGEISKHLADM
ncbi:MAG: ribonuclease HI [Clostridiales bacterium]|nr:ribonuclease HI [Clostridiales bacterium]